MTTAKSAAAVLVATLTGAGTAAADDSWKLTVNNTGNIPLKVVILDSSFKDITGARSPDFISRGSGSVTVKKKGTYHWEVFAKGDTEPCQKQRGVSATSITVHCDRTKAQEKAGAAGTAKTTASGGQQTGSGQQQGVSQQQPQKTVLLQPGGGSSGCSLTNITSKGCPPKILQEMEDLRKKGEDANKALDQAEADLKALDAKDPKNKEKLDAIYQRYNKAKATVEHVKSVLGKPGQPTDNINYVNKLDKKEQDLGKLIKDKARSMLGCVPTFTKTSLGCERETGLGGGRK